MAALPSFDDELAVATNAARAAGLAALAARRRGVLADTKEGGEVVTTADREANAIITSAIQSAFPDDLIFSEESPDPPGRTERSRLWIVDPIDGTSNFVAGGDDFTVSVGLSVDGHAVIGAVYNPVRDELFAGFAGDGDGGGVTINGRSIEPERPRSAGHAVALANARVLVSTKEAARGTDVSTVGLRLTTHASMANKLALVAAGRADVVFSLKRRKEWGVCAGTALVLAGGGIVTTLDGTSLRFNNPVPRPFDGLVAGDAHLHAALRERLREQLRDRGEP